MRLARRRPTDDARTRTFVESHRELWQGAPALYREGSGISLVRLDERTETTKRGLSTACVLLPTPGLAPAPARWTISLICVGDPRKAWDPLSCFVVWPRSGLICVGDPRKAWDPLSCFVVWPRSGLCAMWRWTASRGQGGAPVAQRGRTTLGPTRVRRILRSARMR
jgi:hypothetical protein